MRHQLEYLAVKSVDSAVRPLPLSAVRRLGERLGLAFYVADRVHRRIAIANLEAAFPARTSDDREAIAKAMFKHFGRLLLELLKYSSLSNDEKLAAVDFEGEDRVRLAYAQRKGILFCTGHFGFWEQQALAHALKFEPMAVMARPLDNPKLHDLLERIRVSDGNAVLYRRGAVRKALRLLAEGRGVGILIDQHMTSPDAINVDFFGRPAATTSTQARNTMKIPPGSMKAFTPTSFARFPGVQSAPGKSRRDRRMATKSPREQLYSRTGCFPMPWAS